MAVGADEDVLGLEITVDDACSMKAFDALDDLCSVEPSPITAQTTPSRELGG